uniref:Plasminogen activator n=1 Tax=Scleropages formosus TaxID=113540 RepID=A0A8C9S3E0_SCLFO
DLKPTWNSSPLSSLCHCVDSHSATLHAPGESWLRWKGQRAEFCRCTRRGRERCHTVPVTTCYSSQCYNGGRCKEAVYSSDFLCQCPPGFWGPRCEINAMEKCIVGQGESYRGTWSVSQTGVECLNWNSTVLRGKKFTAMKPEAGTQGLGNHNYCRNPDRDAAPWCYIYKGINIIWDYCTLPPCAPEQNAECAQGNGGIYRGTVGVTKGGTHCLPWDSPAVTRKVYNAWRPDARELGLGSHNYCRNPDDDSSPWCHIYKGSQLTWEHCDIAKCGSKPATITTLGPRAPTTLNRGTSCGQRVEKSPEEPQFRILGGEQSDISTQPWQAALSVYRRRSKVHTFFCGGVLIDSCWVLSAAHCFQERFSARDLQVTLGRTFRLQNSSSEQIFDVEHYWVHEQYDDETYDNDIVLIKLKSDVGMCAVHTDEVLPACLPEPDLALPDWTECEISGYGKEHEFSPFYSDQVKRGHVRLWPQSQCVSEKLSGRLVTPNMLCAGDTRGLDDACKGDSGGPLVCPREGRLTLVGLISWGDGCGKKDTPGVYTHVTKYVEWISSKMQADGN